MPRHRGLDAPHPCAASPPKEAPFGASETVGSEAEGGAGHGHA